MYLCVRHMYIYIYIMYIYILFWHLDRLINHQEPPCGVAWTAYVSTPAKHVENASSINKQTCHNPIGGPVVLDQLWWISFHDSQKSMLTSLVACWFQSWEGKHKPKAQAAFTTESSLQQDRQQVKRIPEKAAWLTALKARVRRVNPFSFPWSHKELPTVPYHLLWLQHFALCWVPAW